MAAIPGSQAAEPSLRETVVFQSGHDGYHTFRIPAIAVTSRGTLLAFAEGRVRGTSDTGNVDAVLKRSSDDGRTWSPLQTLWDDGDNTCGNPCVVVDRASGRIVLLLTHNLGKDPEKKIIARTSVGTRTVWVLTSDDDGLTWSKPMDITPAVKKPDWSWYATGPGAGIQLAKTKPGRLMTPCDHFEDGDRQSYSHVIFSDDGGTTWSIGGSIGPHFNECQVAELGDGTLLLNSRNHGTAERHRGVAISRDGGETWSDVRPDAELIEPVCHAGLTRIEGTDSQLVFVNPADEKARQNLTVRRSDDGGKTWPRSRVLFPGPSAYSSLAAPSEDSIFCLYEHGEKGPYESIVLAKFNADWIASTPSHPNSGDH
jgi:sialidase-1